MRYIAFLLLMGLTACGEIVLVQPAPRPAPVETQRVTPTPVPTRPSVPAQAFLQVVDDMLPVAINECRARTRGVRCDYAIVVDDRPGIPPNAFQTLGPDGQPVVGFTLALIRDAANSDELAFVLGHEAAHHIAGHISRGQASAQTGAILAGAVAALGGGDEVAIERAQNIGAFYGGRRYSKEFELEADALGAILTMRAGYDPIRGVAFFENAPDPGNRFLGTHPPNADRIRVVREVVARQR
ncbi:M48 family metallopeptidase [Palleronia sp. LCG004]|uniref:M48 family metallopeptidase n=1 Tax=Palleronia sp. LCG004 TaxID=3079304 RepID=UPI0029439E97|nr:M48 family metallopeptidase [Palleronia sp. LCG004]WOI55648.1 M48 family metallopeptidase [Palleronia sp. LCG004]